MEQPTNQATAKSINPQKPGPGDYINYVKQRHSIISDKVFNTAPTKQSFVTKNPKMLRIKEIVAQIANANVPVLITGESGTGKEVIAQLIHDSSNRKNEPFIAINCAALPASLLESELFGYEKGAFTGAHQRHMGKFEQANGGTILLDEVTEIDPALQAKLLRVLQEKEIERIGGSGPIQINTRIIATSNRDLKTVVNDGRFRQDLYYRLYVIHLEIPPLKERKDDIELLANHYLDKFTSQFNQGRKRFSEDAIVALKEYHWPGNVRELQNIIQRTILTAKGSIIEKADLPLNSSIAPKNMDWVNFLPIGLKMREVETHFMIETLKKHNGNRTHAAKTLGISLRTLRNKINEFTIMGYEVPKPTMGKAL